MKTGGWIQGIVEHTCHYSPKLLIKEMKYLSNLREILKVLKSEILNGVIDESNDVYFG